ncbi:MAG: hypothetical protein KME16_20965 [Scytolyngbya sp. HA4215-MV1]|nr:hypothetical protein [Scytolyngbya sp. HA4215-MV1]
MPLQQPTTGLQHYRLTTQVYDELFQEPIGELLLRELPLNLLRSIC